MISSTEKYHKVLLEIKQCSKPCSGHELHHGDGHVANQQLAAISFCGILERLDQADARKRDELKAGEVEDDSLVGVRHQRLHSLREARY